MVENKDPVIQALNKAKPYLSNVTFGGLMGYCSGVAAKKIGKAVAFLVGVSFIAIQSAVATGYIQVDWAKIQGDTIKKIDATGDGSLTVDDAKAYWIKFKKIMVNKLPSAGGFSLGFLYGVKCG